MDRDSYLLRLAYRHAIHSPDPSTQNGAILALPDGTPILCTGAFNRFPEGVAETPDRWERPGKYQWIEHAERGSVYAAAHHGIRTRGLTLACCWAACADCARAIVCSGISRLVRHAITDDSGRWRDSIEVGDVILTEGGVEIVELTDSFPDVLPIRRDGVLFQP